MIEGHTVRNTLLIAFVAAALSGCATTPEQLAAKSDIQLCQTYRDARRVGGLIGDLGASHLQEIQRRRLLSENELDLVKNRQIQRGMSLCALYASWGTPYKENRSVGKWGTHIQHVYGTRRSRNAYVYTENGVVTSWQN